MGKKKEKMFYVNENQKKAGEVVLVANKIDFKPKTVTRQCNDKGSINQENITIKNIYVPNIGTPKCRKQILTYLKEETAVQGY